VNTPKTRRSLERVYKRIDDLVQGRLGDGADKVVDAFEPASTLTGESDVRLAQLEKRVLEKSADKGVSAEVIARLGDFLRHAPATDVLTAARIASHPLFRQLYPNEVLAPGSMVRIACVVLLHAEVRGPVAARAADGDAPSFGTLYQAYRALEGVVVEGGGTVVKLMGDGILAVFDSPGAAVRAAQVFDDVVRAVSRDAKVRAAVHRGPAAAVTLNDRLDYFGQSVTAVAKLTQAARDGAVVVSDDIVDDPVVQHLLNARARKRELPARLTWETSAPIAIIESVA
jgi:class 3 adenylate cyclase